MKLTMEGMKVEGTPQELARFIIEMHRAQKELEADAQMPDWLRNGKIN